MLFEIYVQDTQIAENIVEDVFLKVWTNRKRWRVSTSIKPIVAFGSAEVIVAYLWKRDFYESCRLNCLQGLFKSGDELGNNWNLITG